MFAARETALPSNPEDLTLKTPLKPWSIILRGLCMGAADVVPGVSGGTMALILGIYPRFILALSRIDQRVVQLLLGVVRRPMQVEPRQRLVKHLQEIDFFFLVTLGVGIALAFLSLARVIPSLLKTYPAEMNGLFFGMIVASVSIPLKAVGRFRVPQVLALVLSTIFAYWVTGLPVLATTASLPFLFFAGAIAISAMLLPGISGSFLLLVLGQYEYILGALRDLKLDIIGVFVVGLAFGLLAFSRFLRWLLNHYPASTMATLAGLMVGSLRKIWPFKLPLEDPIMVAGKTVQATQNVWPLDASYEGTLAAPLILLGIGLAAVIALNRMGKQNQARGPECDPTHQL